MRNSEGALVPVTLCLGHVLVTPHRIPLLSSLLQRRDGYRIRRVINTLGERDQWANPFRLRKMERNFIQFRPVSSVVR